MKAGILTAYFVKRDEARGALRELGKRGFHRSALIHKTADGQAHISEPFLLRRAIAMTLSAVLFGALAGAVALLFCSSWPSLSVTTSFTFSILGAALLGCLLSPGVDEPIEARSRSETPRGSFPVVGDRGDRPGSPGAHRSNAVPCGLLRESGEIPPVVSVLNPKRESLIEDMGSLEVPLSPAQVQEHARHLAGENQVNPEPAAEHQAPRAARVRPDNGSTWCARISPRQRSWNSVRPPSPSGSSTTSTSSRATSGTSSKTSPGAFTRHCPPWKASSTEVCRASTGWPRSWSLIPVCVWTARISSPSSRRTNPCAR